MIKWVPGPITLNDPKINTKGTEPKFNSDELLMPETPKSAFRIRQI